MSDTAQEENDRATTETLRSTEQAIEVAHRAHREARRLTWYAGGVAVLGGCVLGWFWSDFSWYDRICMFYGMAAALTGVSLGFNQMQGARIYIGLATLNEKMMRHIHTNLRDGLRDGKYAAGMTTDISPFDAINEGRCPKCQCSDLHAGPRGGMNINVACFSCGARYNTAFHEGALVTVAYTGGLKAEDREHFTLDCWRGDDETIHTKTAH